jgi:hypothetical protein
VKPPRQPDLPAEVTQLQTQLRLARAQNGDLHQQLQHTIRLSDLPADVADAVALTRTITALSRRLERAKVAYRTLRQELGHVQGQLADAWAELEARLDDLRAARKETRALQDALAAAQRDIRLWRSLADLADLVSGSTPATPATDRVLKQLIRMAHPDKWSAGQPASALAHEITVALNAAREQVEGRR